MSAKKVQEIERAIGSLSQEELEELRVWLDEYAGPRPIDNRIASDLAAGRLVVAEAIEDHERLSRSERASNSQATFLRAKAPFFQVLHVGAKAPTPERACTLSTSEQAKAPTLEQAWMILNGGEGVRAFFRG